MKEIFEEFGYNLREEQLSAFEKYYELLIFYNNMFNITAITERREAVIKHFIDSISHNSFIKGKGIDIGSGGGFPALPLKIMYPELAYTLVEATEKKCDFLCKIVDNLGLKGVTVVNDRAESLAKNPLYREKFDFCTARAVAKLNTLSEYCLPFVKTGGLFIALKGDADQELFQAENALKILGGKIKAVNKFELDGAKRTVAVIEKIFQTPAKYPRGNGKERKNPL